MNRKKTPVRHPFRPSEEIFCGRIRSSLDLRQGLIEAALQALEEAGCKLDAFFDRLSLDEAISNAILHGNRQDPRKLVTVRAFLNRNRWGVEIADQGRGFDWKSLLKRLQGPPDTESSSGRGIALILASGATMHFLDRGRRVIFVRSRSARTSDSLP